MIEDSAIKNTKIAKPLIVSPFSNCKVDIIIPFHSQYEKVTSLIRSIIIAVKSNPYQITLVDDYSDNKDFHKEINDQFKKEAPEGCRPLVTCIRSEKHVGFGGALKLGYDNTNLPYVLFMHSDCLVEDYNFMMEMGQSLLDWKKEKTPVRMVSARSNNACGLLKAECKSDDKQLKNVILENETLPLFCAMCHRDLFKHIGGFIKSYPYAWYEDEELSHRMRKHGYKQGVSTKSWIYHEGGATIKYLWQKNDNIKDIMEKNHSMCIDDIKKLH